MNMEIALRLGHFAVSIAALLSVVKLVDVFVWYQNEREDRALEREFAAMHAAEEDPEDDDYAGSGGYGDRR